LYVHLPFCEHRCTYCGCAVVITRKRQVTVRYLEYLEREMSMLADALGDRRRLVQLHLGGGTPTYLSLEQIERVDGAIRRHFEVDPGAERAIEIDPRVTSREQLALLRHLGFMEELVRGLVDALGDLVRTESPVARSVSNRAPSSDRTAWAHVRSASWPLTRLSTRMRSC
jgi:hypothetical protein